MPINKLIFTPEEAVKIYVNKHIGLFCATSYEDARDNVMNFLFMSDDYSSFMNRIYKTPELEKHLHNFDPRLIDDSVLYFNFNIDTKERTLSLTPIPVLEDGTTLEVKKVKRELNHKDFLAPDENDMFKVPELWKQEYINYCNRHIEFSYSKVINEKMWLSELLTYIPDSLYTELKKLPYEVVDELDEDGDISDKRMVSSYDVIDAGCKYYQINKPQTRDITEYNTVFNEIVSIARRERITQLIDLVKNRTEYEFPELHRLNLFNDAETFFKYGRECCTPEFLKTVFYEIKDMSSSATLAEKELMMLFPYGNRYSLWDGYVVAGADKKKKIHCNLNKFTAKWIVELNENNY